MSRPQPYAYNATIQRVIDGDTVIMNVDLGFGTWRHAQSFRLLGINAREKSAAGGQEAKANLMQLLPFGSSVVLTSVKADKYGDRYDAVVTLPDGSDLAGQLIQTGWAAAWSGTGERPLPPWPRP